LECGSRRVIQRNFPAPAGLDLKAFAPSRIQHYAPEFEKPWNRFARPAGRSWRVDETYVKIKGRWTYLYRAVDKEGRTVDFLLRAKRDVAAAKAFFRLAFRRQGRLPRKITLDGYQASHRAAKEALDEHPEGNQCKIRSSNI
jgi:transposase-like protein